MFGPGHRTIKVRIYATLGLSIAISVILLTACQSAIKANLGKAIATPSQVQAQTSIQTQTVPSATIALTPAATLIPVTSAASPTQTPPSPTSLPPTEAPPSPTSVPPTAEVPSPSAILSAVSPTPVASIPMMSSSGRRVLVNANLYPALDKSKLRPGDIFKGQSVRAGSPETPLSRQAFMRGVSEVNSIPSNDALAGGFNKSLVFSSYQDLQTYIADAQFPTDVNYVEYNFERNMTPSAEYDDPVGSVTNFASIAHDHGKMVMFGPTLAELRQLVKRGQLTGVLKSVDIVAYQAQNRIQGIGEAGLLAELQQYHALVQASGKAFAAQLWVNSNGCDLMTKVFNETSNVVDVIAIGTHDDGAGANCVLIGLRR